VNFLRHHGHQLQELCLDGEDLTDDGIDAVAACPILRCLKVSFSGQLTDVCLLSLKVSELGFIFFYLNRFNVTLHTGPIKRKWSLLC